MLLPAGFGSVWHHERFRSSRTSRVTVTPGKNWNNTLCLQTSWRDYGRRIIGDSLCLLVCFNAINQPFILFLFTCLRVSSRHDANKLVQQSVLLLHSWDPQISESKRTNDHIIPHRVPPRTALSRAVSLPGWGRQCVLISKQPAHFTACEQPEKRKVAAPGLLFADVIIFWLHLIDGAVRKDLHITLSQGCRHLESNFPMKKN